MDIVVLAGGVSMERDVSLSTGREVSRALRNLGHRVLLLDVYLGYGGEGADPEEVFARSEEASAAAGEIAEQAPDIDKIRAMRKDGEKNFFGPNVIRLCQAADIVFMGLHGENGENGKVQAAFDLFGIRYTGSDYLSSAMAMDKELAKKLFRANGVPTPDGIAMKRPEVRELADTGVALPCVVKPNGGGSSIGVSIVRTEEEYGAALAEAFRCEDEVIVESYIKGREFSVAVLAGKALPIIEIAPKEGFYDYKNKYQAGSTVETCPADLPAETASEMQRLAVRAADALGLSTYSRMDFLLNEKGEMYCLEANTLPGMTPVSLIPQEAAAAGMSYEELCAEILRVSMEKYEGGKSRGMTCAGGVCFL